MKEQFSGSDTEIFIDVDDIPLGANFATFIAEQIDVCDVVLALIGPNWLHSSASDGSRRLDDPKDFVRLEIAAALKGDVPVVPVLLDGAGIPLASQLPSEIADLAMRNGVEIRRQHFVADSAVLARRLRHVFEMQSAGPAEQPTTEAEYEAEADGSHAGPDPSIDDTVKVEGRADTFADLFDGLFSKSNKAGSSGNGERGEDVRYRMEIDFVDAVTGARRRVVMSDGRELNLVVPAGVKTGNTLRLRQQGRQSANGGPPGDALIEVTVAPHSEIQRDEDDLRMDLLVSLMDAMEGARVPVYGPTGALRVKLPARVQTGAVLRLRGKGVQRAGKPGDLFVRVLLDAPMGDPKFREMLMGWSRRR